MTTTTTIDAFERENRRWPTRRERFEYYNIDDEIFGWRTRGLGEPFAANEGPETGYGCELYVESRSNDDQLMGVALQALREMADAVISKPDIPRLVSLHKTIPYDMEQANVPYPLEYRCKDGTVGCLVGMRNPWHEPDEENSSGHPIRLIPIKPLLRNDTLRVRMGGAPRCRQLFAEYKNRDEYHMIAFPKNDSNDE